MSTLDRDPDADPALAPVRDALAETGASLVPKPGWEQAVWDRIDAERVDARRGVGARRRWLAGGAVLAAAAIVLLVWRPWRGSEERARGGDPQVAVAEPTIEIRRSATVVRGAAAAPGDSAVVRHAGAGAVVWIYRGESTLVRACDAGRLAPPACRADGVGVVVEHVLDRPGTYHVLTAVGSPDTLAPPDTLDAALAVLTTASLHFRHDELDVR